MSGCYQLSMFFLSSFSFSFSHRTPPGNSDKKGDGRKWFAYVRPVDRLIPASNVETVMGNGVSQRV